MNTPAEKQNFPLYSCGLGTFLSIANFTITDKLESGEYTRDDALCLQNQAVLALYNLGGIAEQMGLERIDYANDLNPQGECAIALMLFGRAVHEMAYSLECLLPYIHYPTKPQDNTFPPPDGC